MLHAISPDCYRMIVDIDLGLPDAVGTQQGRRWMRRMATHQLVHPEARRRLQPIVENRVRSVLQRHDPRDVDLATATICGVMGPARALQFLEIVHLATDWGVVAGSAALFLEMICTTADPQRVPDWEPGDVDCFVENSNFALGLMREMTTAMCTGKPTVTCSTSSYATSGPWDDRIGWQGPDSYGPPDESALGPNTHVVNVDVGAVHVQVVHQMNDEERTTPRLMLGDILYREYSPPRSCGCRQRDGDRVCSRCVRPCSDQYTREGTYALQWQSGFPHHSFDLDVISVAVVRIPGGKRRFDRPCGDPFSPVMRLLPTGIWKRNDEATFVANADVERLRQRVDKYAARGWTTLEVPDRCTTSAFCDDDHQPVWIVEDTPEEFRRMPADMALARWSCCCWPRPVVDDEMATNRAEFTAQHLVVPGKAAPRRLYDTRTVLRRHGLANLPPELMRDTEVYARADRSHVVVVHPIDLNDEHRADAHQFGFVPVASMSSHDAESMYLPLPARVRATPPRKQRRNV